ncbi:2669_t:CDS:1, partial [Scutellospora calospora]
HAAHLMTFAYIAYSRDNFRIWLKCSQLEWLIKLEADTLLMSNNKKPQ